MKINPTATLIAAGYLLINALFYKHATSLNGGKSMVYIFIYPIFWIITLVTVIVLAIKNRKTWFKKEILFSTLIALFLCTPVPISLFALLLRPASYLVASGGNGDQHKTFEEWNYYSGGRAANKYWTEGYKDSVWVYFDKKGDTLKTETYKNDSLMTTKEYKKGNAKIAR